MDMSEIGDRVREVRERLKMSQAELGRAVGVTRNAINQIESGATKNPRPQTIYAIADALGVSDRWIVFGGEPMPEPRGPPASQQDLQILETLKRLTPSQKQEEWQRLQDTERRNAEILATLKASGE